MDSSERIVVGYAFGPKKMSTMGAVMEEASKATTLPIEESAPTMWTSTTPSSSSYEQSSTPSVIIDFGTAKRKHLTQVIRHFQRSFCSSVASGITATTVSDYTLQSTLNYSTSSSFTLCFVPLDPDIPLEEQHCGQIDVILHKLTEDILTWNKRIQNLVSFCEKSGTVLVDDPRNVRNLVSRAEIAHRLESVLEGVTTLSGIPVRTPCCAVETPKALNFPVIAKPLTAAGSKASHAMTVLLHSDAPHIPADCIFQEYKNHGAVLYKVYVLGQHISVHQRPSLPDLPPSGQSTLDAVAFDSQRQPYPDLEKFGYSSTEASSFAPQQKHSLLLTAPQLLPVVDALKRAFGLELFGFDLIYYGTALWVVDVNYFPSYKEVGNFPTLLANVLAEAAMSRR